MPRFRDVIAIDGPAGAGKTTLGHWLSDHLALPYLETGFLYRAATYNAITHRLEGDAWDASLLESVEVAPRRPAPDRHAQQILIDGGPVDVERDLFSLGVDELVARVSAVPSVRDAVRTICRQTASERPIIVSGRDVGVSILPHAAFKLFLTADELVRSARLAANAAGVTPSTASYHPTPEVPTRETRERLESRLLALHLVPAPDAHVIDTTHLSVHQVRAEALRRLPEPH